MRFIVSVVLYAVALIMIVAGILVHSVFMPPSTLSQSITIDNPSPYIVIDSNSLNRISPRQTISVEGGASGLQYSFNADGTASSHQGQSDNVVLAWGRRADVLAYIGDMSYDEISTAGKTGTLSASTTGGVGFTSPTPWGSDLWVDQFQDKGTVSHDVALGQGGMLLIATDGTLPAPKTITVTWQLAPNSTIPRNLFYGGIASGLLGGIVFFIGWAIDRRQRRHRQRRMPRAPKPPRYRPPRSSLRQPKRRTGRRSMRFVATVALLPSVLAGCSIVPNINPTPIPTVVPLARGVAVTEPQFARILKQIVATLTTADSQNSAVLAAKRLSGAALRFREAHYKVSSAKDIPEPFHIPNGSVRLLLPQKTTDWPRSVFAVIDDPTKPKAPSVAIVLTQQSPRENYFVSYEFALEPGAKIPAVPTADVGGSAIIGDTELLAVSPSQAAGQYGDILINGDSSPFAGAFKMDSLQEQIGAAAKAKREKAMYTSAKFSWTDSIPKDEPISFGTADAGALVAITLQESEIVKPKVPGSAITPTGAVKALLGADASMQGIKADYQFQLLFYIPALGSTDTMRLLGYSYALVGGKKLGQSPLPG